MFLDFYSDIIEKQVIQSKKKKEKKNYEFISQHYALRIHGREAVSGILLTSFSVNISNQ